MALVTGASSGIGQACAVQLVSSGWRVLAGVRRAGEAPDGTVEVLLDVTPFGSDPRRSRPRRSAGRSRQQRRIAIAAPVEFVSPERLRAGFERLPDRLRDRIYERVLLKS